MRLKLPALTVLSLAAAPFVYAGSVATMLHRDVGSLAETYNHIGASVAALSGAELPPGSQQAVSRLRAALPLKTRGNLAADIAQIQEVQRNLKTVVASSSDAERRASAVLTRVHDELELSPGTMTHDLLTSYNKHAQEWNDLRTGFLSFAANVIDASHDTLRYLLPDGTAETHPVIHL